MLIICPECTHKVSDQAFICPLCGFPIAQSYASAQLPQPSPIVTTRRAKSRKKHKKLPNGFGSIKKLSGNRTNPYAAYPATKAFHLNGSPVKVPAIGYYADWYKAFDALTEYNKDPYDLTSNDITFGELYNAYFKSKFEDNKKKNFSKSTINSTNAAFKNCSALHDRKFKDLRKPDMQEVLDSCPLKHASLELILSLFHQMYKFARENDIVEKDYSEFVQINIPDDDESGEPFSQKELDILWHNADNKTIQTILILIYTGFRVSAFKNMNVNTDEQYLQGGVKTFAGKNRIVPINPLIKDFITKDIRSLPIHQVNYRTDYFYPILEKLGILYTDSGKKHTPHDCRHTFSWLCDKYKVDEFSKHLLMGHAITGDVEKSVYGHRTIEELRTEIEKIQK